MNFISCVMWLYVGLFSFHGGSHANGVHEPVGIEYQCKQVSYGFVSFTNSFKDKALMSYITGRVEENKPRFNYVVGLVDGYGDEILPVIYPTISYKYKSLGADLGCLPNSENHVTCALTVRVKLW